ncbi:MAG: DUF378 domain-containing protein [Candidatus Komeilibacteria bacterium]
MKGLAMIAWILLIIGGLNWLLIGIFDWNIVDILFGSWMWLVKLIYILVGLSALYLLFTKKPGKTM